MNSGTTIHDVEKMIDSTMRIMTNAPNAQVFLFFDEMNTADPLVIAFLKELMLDRHCNGTVLPENLHLIAAANPYRHLQEADKEAADGLAFRFAQTGQAVDGEMNAASFTASTNCPSPSTTTFTTLADCVTRLKILISKKFVNMDCPDFPLTS